MKSFIKSCLLGLASLLFINSAYASQPYTFTYPTVAALEAAGTGCGLTISSAYVQGIGIYQWNSTSTATPDPNDTPQTIVQCTTVTTGRMVLQNGAVGTVANIAALEALPDAPIGMTVNVGGTQGGSFTVVSGTLSASDGGTTFFVSNSAGGTYTDRYWQRNFSGSLNQYMFGAKCDGNISNPAAPTGTDDAAAIQAMYNAAYALGKQVTLIGTPGVTVCLVSTTIEGKANTVFDASLYPTATGYLTIRFDGATYTNLTKQPLYLMGSAPLYGAWQITKADGSATSEYVLFVNNVPEVHVFGVHVADSRFMAMHFEYGTDLYVSYANVLDSVADGINAVGFQHVWYQFNTVEHSEDNCLANHTDTTEVTTYGTTPDKSFIAFGNLCIDAAGIAMQGPQKADVTFNHLIRNKGVGITVGTGFSTTQGFLTPFDVTISDNSIIDTIACAGIGVHCTTPDAYAIYVTGFATVNADTVPYENYLYTNSSTATLGPSLAMHIVGNTLAQTLGAPPGGLYSGWGYGDWFTANGFTDPTIGSQIMATNTVGIASTNCGLANGGAYQNHIIGFAIGADFSCLDKFDWIDNDFFRFKYYGMRFGATNTGYVANSLIQGNRFNGDPYYESTARDATTHDWTSYGFPIALGSDAPGSETVTSVFVQNNYFTNVSSAIRSPILVLEGDWANNTIDYNGGLGTYFTPVQTATITGTPGTVNTGGTPPEMTLTTPSLTTAAGSTYQITWSSTWINAYSLVQCRISGGSNTTGTPVITSIAPASGFAVVTITNVGASALNGTVALTCSVQNAGQ